MKVSKKETQLTASDRLPYEKFLQKGAESLSDAELLAIMLRTGPNPGPDAPQAFRDCPALALAEQVLSLPAKYRLPLYLYYYEGYSVREIASLLGQSESAVSAHLSRGRKSLRTILGGDLYEQRV